MAKVRGLALVAALALAGCGGSSAPDPPRGGDVLRLALPLVPATLDPARVADLPSLNVAHELNAGLTRFSGTGVEPDLAESWDVEQNGLVWTFHLRKGIRWSNDAPITAEDFRRSWLRALSPSLHSAFARAEMQNIAGARRYRVTGRGEIGVEAVDERTLRVTLAHPVPWLDEQVAWPVFFPLPASGSATSGPFRLAARSARRLVLERNFNYWNAAEVKPSRLVLSTTTENADAVLPRGVLAPGFPWIDTTGAERGTQYPTLSLELLWLATRASALADVGLRRVIRDAAQRLRRVTSSYLPEAMPGEGPAAPPAVAPSSSPPLRLTLAYTREDAVAPELSRQLRRQLARRGIALTVRRVPTYGDLLRLAGPPPQAGIDLVLLGWSAEFYDEYNVLDLFTCGSAFNVARWCDPAYDGLMRRAVRELDDEARFEIEQQLLEKLQDAVPAIAFEPHREAFALGAGVTGLAVSPIGIYELMGMTRS